MLSHGYKGSQSDLMLIMMTNQDNLTELSIPFKRSLGDAVRALGCQVRRFSYLAVKVAVCPLNVIHGRFYDELG